MSFRRRFRKIGKSFRRSFKKVVGRARRSFGKFRKKFVRVRRSSGFASRGGVLRGG